MSQKERLDIEETLAKVCDLKIKSAFSAAFSVSVSTTGCTQGYFAKKQKEPENVARKTYLGSGDLIEPQESANEKHARDAVQLCYVCCEVSNLRCDHFEQCQTEVFLPRFPLRIFH